MCVCLSVDVCAQADPLRVLLPTEASMGVDDKGGAAFKDINGYTIDQLYKDQRLKVHGSAELCSQVSKA